MLEDSDLTDSITNHSKYSYLAAKFTLINPDCCVGVDVDAVGVVGMADTLADWDVIRPDLLGVAGVLLAAR